MRQDNRLRIYPEYFDAGLTRAQGRRVSSKQALENPTLGELRISAQKLNYSVEYDKGMAYSRQWDKPKGMLYITTSNPDKKVIPKTQLLRDLSKTVKEYARPYLAEKAKELAKAEAQNAKKGKQFGPTTNTRPSDKKQPGKPMRRRR